MPNHIQNRITLDGDPKKITEMLEKTKNDKYGIGTIDFQKIIPITGVIVKLPISGSSEQSQKTK